MKGTVPLPIFPGADASTIAQDWAGARKAFPRTFGRVQNELEGLLGILGSPEQRSELAGDFLPRPVPTAEETAVAIRGLRPWITDEYEHNGLRADGERVLGRLLDLVRGRV
jgi:hypothetical protein